MRCHRSCVPASNGTVRIKRFLDVGSQTLLIPHVQSAEEARAAVAAMHHAPRGVRDVAGTTRATHFGRVEGYHKRVSEELCLLVQVEPQESLNALEDIAARSTAWTACSSAQAISPRARAMPGSACIGPWLRRSRMPSNASALRQARRHPDAGQCLRRTRHRAGHRVHRGRLRSRRARAAPKSSPHSSRRPDRPAAAIHS
jgi:hypothetical protein